MSPSLATSFFRLQALKERRRSSLPSTRHFSNLQLVFRSFMTADIFNGNTSGHSTSLVSDRFIKSKGELTGSKEKDCREERIANDVEIVVSTFYSKKTEQSMQRQPTACAQSFHNRIGLEKRKQFMQNQTRECDSCIIGWDLRMPLIAILNGIARRELVLPAQDANRLPRRGLSSTSTRKVKDLGALRLAERCSSQEWYKKKEKVVVPATLN
ncbi:hypothetical protein LXL04_003821 [Taraxacum kok-saghyz]